MMTKIFVTFAPSWLILIFLPVVVEFHAFAGTIQRGGSIKKGTGFNIHCA
ncbi:MAG: hypothetical protein SF029_21715 [bacterium]|nr:hypothetical protein [bacterium]